jgi:3-phenylpropionate/trans-cinnamate dioxygenase ferredoxin reductase subunit
MSRVNRIGLNGQVFFARAGERLLDAAMASGVDLPHDCRAGRCGSCLTRIASGVTLGGETHTPGIVHACQALVFSDLELEVEPLPPVGRRSGHVAHVAEIARDIVEVVITPSAPLDMLPGQYCRFRFRGYPARPFSPTAALGRLADDGKLRLNIKRVRDGRVTPHVGKSIKVGHAVQVEGPFGHAFLRPHGSGRLVLVGSGTGFAPIWAVASAALRERPDRPIVLIAASRKLEAFYMAPALTLASRHAGVSIIAAVEELDEPWHGLLPGGPLDHLPPMAPDDTVYGAGSPAMVASLGEAAVAAGATFYSDPFESAAPPRTSWIETAKVWLKTG